MLHPDDREYVVEKWRSAVATGEEFEVEARVRTATGEYRAMLVRAAPLRDEKGHVVKWYGVSTDIEDLRRAVEALRESEETLRSAQAELAHANRVATMGQLTASIAHEVNQPLAGVVANAEACLRWLDRETPNLDTARRSVECIINDGNRASEVIRRVRALATKTETKQEPLDINSAISEVVPLVKRELINHKVSLRTELEPALPAVLADRVQLHQVIINLVMNSIEAMQSVTDRPRELVIGSHEDETHRVLVTVTDSGVGISAENADRLFNAFFTTKSSGMGMGLSICRSIVEAHGGRMSAANNVGPGATFQCVLPVQRQAAS